MIPPVSGRRPFESWWAYVSYGQDNPLAVLADRSSHLDGDRFYFRPTHRINYNRGELPCGGPLANGQHETPGATALLQQCGLALFVGDERLRELVVGHSQLDIEVAQKSFAGFGVPFRLFTPQAAGEEALTRCSLPRGLPSGFPEMEAREYTLLRQCGLPTYQSFCLVWRMSRALSARLLENERSNAVPIVVCAFVRGKERVPVG